ncbi:MAG: XdhC family protein [Rhodocyclaceae bacterium]|nr:XdhC family protein [Rhodocyclaceae bacterium]
MESCELDVLRTARDWLAEGRRVVMATVVRTWGSSPRPPGSMMIIRDDGQVAGSVSGGCIEDDLIDRLANHELELASPAETIYGANAEEARRFGLPCGGSVQIVLEPLNAGSAIDELLAAIEGGGVLRRQLDMRDGLVTLGPSANDDTLHYDGCTLATVHGPRYRLLIIGAGQLSRYLAAMALMLDYQVTVCDPRIEYHEGWQQIPGAELSAKMPDDLVTEMELDARSAVVALTHDPKLDDLGLMEALRTEAFYVGALGSRRNNDARRQRLLEFELSAEQIARLRGPVGLRLGALTPPEIVVSILAEMTALRRGVSVPDGMVDWGGSTTQCRTAAHP